MEKKVLTASVSELDIERLKSAGILFKGSKSKFSEWLRNKIREEFETYASDGEQEKVDNGGN